MRVRFGGLRGNLAMFFAHSRSQFYLRLILKSLFRRQTGYIVAYFERFWVFLG